MEHFSPRVRCLAASIAAIFGVFSTAASAQCVSITKQPESQTVNVSDTAIFTLTATGGDPLTYQWQQQDLLTFDFINIDDGDVYDPFGNVFCAASGTTTNELTLSEFTGVAQVFRCLVSNPCGGVPSSEVTLTFNEPCPSDFDHDGFVTGDDFDKYVVAFEQGDDTADFDFDGFVTGDDFDSYVLAFEAGC